MRINELGKKVGDWEVKLKQQQQLYESVRSDRNLYSKNLIDAQDEIAEMKRKLKIMEHQVEQLKEDITAKVGLDGRGQDHGMLCLIGAPCSILAREEL